MTVHDVHALAPAEKNPYLMADNAAKGTGVTAPEAVQAANAPVKLTPYELFTRHHGEQYQFVSDALETLPTQIQHKQLELADLQGDANELRARLDEIEAITAAAISTEKDPDTGKAAFSNEGARKAELTKRLAADADYRSVSERLRDIERDISSVKFEIDKLRDQFAAARSQARMIANIAGLFAS